MAPRRPLRLAREAREKLKEYQEKFKSAMEASPNAPGPQHLEGEAEEGAEAEETEAGLKTVATDEAGLPAPVSPPELGGKEGEGETEEGLDDKLTQKEKHEIVLSISLILHC